MFHAGQPSDAGVGSSRAAAGSPDGGGSGGGGSSSSGGSSDSSLSAAGACRLRHELENHFTAHLWARADADRIRRERDGAQAALLAAEGLVVHYRDQRDAARRECDVLRAQRDAARTA